MKHYKDNFKGYLQDLGDRKPAPGGGSAVCLVFCLGVGLVAKAVKYSISLKSKDTCQLTNNKELKKSLTNLEALKKKIYPYIDKDGDIFEKVMLTKGQKRARFVKESNQIILNTKDACRKVFSLAKEIESSIKKSIISDFNIGLDFIKSTAKGCEANLKANRLLITQIKERLHRLKTKE
ncbi:MAG: cyclodeaminase/cyclohydrolase family protein [Candidatus Omnitrophota bacterium]